MLTMPPLLHLVPSILLILASITATPIDTAPAKRADGVYIYSGRDGKCLSIPAGSQPADGTPVVSVDCDGAKKWDIVRGSGSVILSGTRYALDIGLDPGNNGRLKVWTSFPGVRQQT